MKDILYILISLAIVLFAGCGTNGSRSDASLEGDSLEVDYLEVDSTEVDSTEIDTVVETSIRVGGELHRIMYDNHVITGQKAQHKIIGTFDGVHVDTLYIAQGPGEGSDVYPECHYYLCSSSGRLPAVELYGCSEMAPLIYEEGDLDGNGTDEIGYLHTGVNSQWRYYRILTYRKNRWMYMFKETEDFLDTSQFFRVIGREIAKPAKEKGKVCITYMTEGVDADIRDTIVKPCYTEIVMDD